MAISINGEVIPDAAVTAEFELLRSTWKAAKCYWQALFDPTAKKFVTIRINDRG